MALPRRIDNTTEHRLNSRSSDLQTLFRPIGKPVVKYFEIVQLVRIILADLVLGDRPVAWCTLYRVLADDGDHEGASAYST
jgi:hypothetical protein